MLNKITKAIFPVAGMGSRFLPATKASPKEMMPIVDKPLIQYAVEEAIEAGITDLIFITNHAKRSIEDHFDTNFELEYDKSKNLEFDDYFGGVTMFSSDSFERINGYSNLYWGWGFEDDDLLFRAANKKIALDSKIIGKNEFKKSRLRLGCKIVNKGCNVR